MIASAILDGVRAFDAVQHLPYASSVAVCGLLCVAWYGNELLGATVAALMS